MQTSIKLNQAINNKPRFSAKFKETLKQMKEYKLSYLMITPFMLIFMVFTVIPVAASLLLGMMYYNVLELPRWVGWDNYVRLFINDDLFQIALVNTLKMALIIGPVGYLMCLLFAWIVNELPPKLKPLMTLVFYAPSIAGAAEIWRLMFSGDIYGYWNSFLLRFGFIDEPVQWLKDTRYMMTCVILVQLWMSLGTSFLQLRAGFNTLDKQYFEAAAVDGVNNRWQELWYVTLPLMAPHLWLAAVLQVTSSFGVGDVANALCGFPSTGYAVHTITAHLKDYSSTRFERGYAAAISTVLFIISYGANKLAQAIIRKVGK